jgi:hypothetical protein
MITLNCYYTYAYLRENGTPYYIGKGKGNRAYSSNGRKVKIPPKDRILFLKRNLTEEEAFKHEIYMIALYGRKDLGAGILHNFTDGGEGQSGVVCTENKRRKTRERNLQMVADGTHPAYKPENRKAAADRMSAIAKKLWAEGNHFLQTPAGIEKLKERNLKDVERGTHNLQGEEASKRASDMQLKRSKEGTHQWKSEEHSRRVSERLKGTKCWVNREGKLRREKEKPEGEWQNGRVWKEGR